MEQERHKLHKIASDTLWEQQMHQRARKYSP